MKAKCKHCKLKRSILRRGLCRRCYDHPTIRERYPSYSKYTAHAPLGNRPPCRHCHSRPANRPLVLCWNCYYTHSVREMYVSKVNNGVGADVGIPKTPKVPIRSKPGTLAKMRALAERARLGMELWSPMDSERSLS